METEKLDAFPGLPEEFVRQNAKYMRLLQGFRLLDDDFMSKVFEDKECAQLLLHIILERSDLIVQEAHGQYSIKNLQGAPFAWIFWRLTRRGNTTILRSSGRTRARTHAVPDTTAAS